MQSNLPTNVLMALKEAALAVFWTKKDLRGALGRCGVNGRLVSEQDWSGYKRDALDPILEKLNRKSSGRPVLIKLINELLAFSDCNHLLRWDDGETRKEKGESALAQLRKVAGEYDELVLEQRRKAKERASEVEKHIASSSMTLKLEELNNRFMEFWSSEERQARGYGLEQLLYDLFLMFELNPRGSFKNTGEQIDGAFIHDSTDFLLEAKWTKDKVQLHDLRDLDGGVRTKLENTLGLFISIHGFTDEAIQGYRAGDRPRIICMDGADLITVLSQQVELPFLIRRKRSVAAQRGEIMVSAQSIILGKA